MALITVGNITIDTTKIRGIQVIKCDTAYHRGKSKILAPHPLRDYEVFTIIEAPHEQINDIYEKIRKAWYINTSLYIPEPREMSEDERIKAYSEVYQNNDQLVYDGMNWLLYRTHKDIVVANKIVVHGSSDPEMRKREKRVYTNIDTEEGLEDLFNELGEIISDNETRTKIIKRLKGEITHTVY